jgi:hypothetical protein
MGIGVRGIELRGGLEFTESLGQTAFLTQCQAQAAVRRLDFRLRLNGLPEGLFRPCGVVSAQALEPLQDKVPSLL